MDYSEDWPGDELKPAKPSSPWYSEETAPESMILLLGIEKFLGLLEVPSGAVNDTWFKIIQTDDEFKAELEQPPTDDDFKDATKNLWDVLKAEEREKGFEVKPQTPNAWNKEFSELMSADQQALVDDFRHGVEHENLLKTLAVTDNPAPSGEDPQRVMEHLFPLWTYRQDEMKRARAIEKIIPIQKTGEELKKEMEKFQEENSEGNEIFAAHEDVHTCKIVLDKSALKKTNASNRMHKEWDKKHPDNTWNRDLHYAVKSFRLRWEYEKKNPGKSYAKDGLALHPIQSDDPARREATELEKEYHQFLKEFESANPFALDENGHGSGNIYSFFETGDFEGALSYLKENIDEFLYQCAWQDGPFRNLAQVYQKLARYDDALVAIELQLLISRWDWDYFTLVDILLDMGWKFDAITVLKSMEKRISCWKNPFPIVQYPERLVHQLLDSFQIAYNRIGDAPKEQEYIEKMIELQKSECLQSRLEGWAEFGTEVKIKTHEKLAKCLLKQGKFKDASVILGEANKLRDEFATQKPAEKKENLSAEEIKDFPIDHPEFIQAFANEIIKEQEETERILEKPKTGKGFEDPFPNMSEDDYVGTMEFEFRNIIVNKLMRFTNWEKERVPQDVWEKAAELKKNCGS